MANVSAVSLCLVVSAALLFVVKLKLWHIYFGKLNDDDDDDDDDDFLYVTECVTG